MATLTCKSASTPIQVDVYGHIRRIRGSTTVRSTYLSYLLTHLHTYLHTYLVTQLVTYVRTLR